MKLDIDSICEAKIRHYGEVFNEAMSGESKDKDIGRKLTDAAMLVASSMDAKLQTEDSYNRMYEQEQRDTHNTLRTGE